MTGSLQEKGGMYYAVLNFKDKDGDRKQKWIKTGLAVKGNKRKAEQILNELILENSDYTYIPGKILFCDYVTDWVEMSKPNIQVTTYDIYAFMLRKHICPYFKKLKLTLEQVQPIHISKYHQAKIKEGLSPNTVIKHHAIIRSALQSAVKQKLIRENPADAVDKPKRKKFTSDYYNQNEIRELLTVIKGSSIETPVFLACYFGLRRSEVLGLRWDAVDFVNRNINIKHKVVRASIDGKMALQCTDDLKTQSSYRTLPLDDTMFNYFCDLKEKVNLNMEKSGYIFDYEDYICVMPNGDLLKPDYVSGKFKKLLSQYVLKHIRFHDLRHTDRQEKI